MFHLVRRDDCLYSLLFDHTVSWSLLFLIWGAAVVSLILGLLGSSGLQVRIPLVPTGTHVPLQQLIDDLRVPVHCAARGEKGTYFGHAEGCKPYASATETHRSFTFFCLIDYCTA